MRNSNLATILLAGSFLATAGCGKIPTWGELTGQAQSQQAPAKPVQVSPQIPQAEVAPPKATEPSPDEVIARFSSLQSSQITDGSLFELTTLKEGADRVTEINADNSQLTKNAFEHIDRLTGLRQLRLNHTLIDNDVCQKLASLTSLEVLALADTQVTDVGIAALSGLQNLKYLELTRCRISENGFHAIGNLPSLKTILIDSTALNDRSLDLLCNASTLTELTLSRNNISDFGLAALKKLEPLEYLEIGNTSISGEGLSKLIKGGGLKNLRYLGVYACPITEKGAKAISTIKSLERLNIGSVPMMNDIGLASIIGGMKDLKYINLSLCVGIDGSGLKVLKNSKEMEVVLIDQCPKVGDGVISILKTMKNLKRVGLGSTAVTPRGRQELKSALPDAEIF